MSTRSQALFLDRDGVIIRDARYLSRPEQVELLDGAAALIGAMNARGVPVVVVTNQSGLARGLLSEDDLNAVHARMMELLFEEGAYLDAIYVCPHHPFGSVARWTQVCSCRKPAPGLFHRAAEEMSLDLSSSVMIGDKQTDIEAGNAAGCVTALIHSTLGFRPLETDPKRLPSLVLDDLLQALAWLEQRMTIEL